MKQALKTLLFAALLGVCGMVAAQGTSDESVTSFFGKLLPRLGLGGGSGPQLQFNHNATGFPLEGAHLREACESCHTQGVFRGTPRDCVTCHVSGGRAPGKPSTHIPTTGACDTCHRTLNWTSSIFNHLPTQGVAPGACISCHNGAYVTANALAKPLMHPVTTAACDSCHKTGAWLPAGYTHALVDAGKCATCHNGTRATGKPANHIPTSAACDACHSAGMTWAPVAVSITELHRAMTGPLARANCSTCHSGAFVSQNAQVKPATHIPTTQQCDTCHSASFSTWATGTFDHDAAVPAVANRCSTCHGVSALGKPSSHVPTSAQCDSCHTNTGAFKPAQMNHVGLAGQCASCHNGAYNFANAQAKSVSHIPTASQCDACHVAGFVNWSPAAMNHAGTAGKCIGCHSGGFISQNAQTKPATHLATTAQCDSCHTSTTTWATANFNHAAATPAVAGRCATCHNSVAALGKPVSHVPTSAQCDTCHTSFAAFKPAQMNHASTSGQCSSCHNGSYLFANALARPTKHIPSIAQCDSCHVAGFVNWSPATMNHAGMSGQCAICHSGSYVTQNAQVKPMTHVSTTAQCDTCHTSTTTWATATYKHETGAAGNCATCHNGATALGKPTNHIPITAQCDSCHNNFSAFKPARMSHTGTAGQCATCHSGSYSFANALAKPSKHIPTTAQCDSCHIGGYTAFSPATMNHAGLAGQCSTCHSGAYLAQNAQTKTATHIATTAQCDTCHNSTTSWATGSFNHATAAPPVAGRCATCHNGTNALGKPTTHIPTTAQCDTCHTNQTTFAPATMSHSGTAGPAAVGNCATCHSGAYLFANAQTKTPSHVATTAQCDTCHRSTVTWTGASFSHDANAIGNCATCHNGTAALGKPATHIPTTVQCDTCHSNYAVFKPARMNHAGTAAQCATCHSGGYTAMNALAKPTTHVPTAAQCDTCHINGFVSFVPGTMNHAATSAPVAAGNCATCHSGAYVAQNAQIKTPTHIATAAQCDSCHNSTTTWATGTFNHATATPAVAGRCATCHNGTNALGKPTTHVPTTAQCDTCHTSFVAFAPAVMSHSGTAGPVASGNCATCHGGAYTAINAQAKSATHIATTQSCDTCHNTTAWKPVSYTHQGVVAGTCATCHNGTAALGKSSSHLPTTARCDACHINYVAFAPATMNHAATTGPASAGNCSTCHSGAYLAINAQIKPATHIATTVQCDTCHKSTSSWATASYVHDATVVGRCATCHNGTSALGKPTTHVPTTAQCDTCHGNFAAFRPAQMSHAATTGPVAAGNCTTCHNGSFTAVNALSKPTTHIPTTSQCDTCHTNQTAFAPATMNHAAAAGPAAAGNCATCHSGAYLAQNAQTKTPTHIATTAQCDSCHGSTTSWATATFNHAAATPAVTGRCATCHNGTSALGKPNNHIPTSAQCDTCHTNQTSFTTAAMNHGATTGPAAAGNCSTCHGGTYVSVNALAKPATHVATTAQCDTCHTSTVTWTSASYAHAATAVGTCSTCHNGTAALGKPATHIPTTVQCDTCHTNYTAFKPARMNHAGTAAQCATCHNGSYTALNALGKPTTHVPTATQCDTCHINGFVSFAAAKMSHAATSAPVAAGNCATCHGGAYLSQNAQTKTPTHIATTAQCDSCHNSTTTWATATFNHATATPAVAGRCATCHNGTNAVGKPSNHLPTTAQCDTCHTSFVAFAPATMSHSGTAGPVASGNCATCHGGAYTAINAQAKSATHIATTQSCDTCHNTTAWKPASYAHQGVVAGTCATCHNGTNALGKPATHLPTSAACDGCHKNYSAFAPAAMSHTATTGPAAAGNCSTCHSGSYLAINAQVKPATHVATTVQCDTCHKSTSSWATVTYSHDATAVGKCSTCHNGTTALGKPTTHIPTTAQCSTCHNNYSAFRPAQMNHAATTGPVATGNCATCHNGSYTAVNALAKPTTHIPTTSLCSTCHTGYVAFAPATMSHGGTAGPVAAGNCATCHSGAYVAQNAQTKTPTHIATTAQCDSCHNSTTSWATATFNHAAATPAVTGRCSTCHNGTSALGKTSTHIPTTAQCDVCHTNQIAFAPATMSHSRTTGPSAAGNCATCHNGAYTGVGAQAKPATHMPTTQSCDVCHTTTAWKPTTFTHQGVVTGSCATCHNGTTASGKPSGHIPSTQSCDGCHRTGLSWLPLITPYAHTGVVAGSCATCHSSSYANIEAKPANHLPTTASCDACHHSYSIWLPVTFAHAGVATGTCQTCHGGSYTGITVKPAGNGHIPTTTPAGMPGNECSLCHTSTSSFTTERMNHGSMQTSCVTCHDSTSPYPGNMDKINRARHNSAGTKDCSSSGCHKPLGSRGRPYTSWD